MLAWADNGPRTVCEVHEQAIDASACKPATVLCATSLQSTSAYAGACAYDAARRGIWCSEGKALEQVAEGDCKVLCRSPAALMNSAAVVSGLASYDGGRRLLQLETSFGYAALRSYDASTCPPTPLRDGCRLTIPSTAVCAGLCVDELRGLAWVSVTIPGILTSRNFLRAHKLADKCTQICEVEIPVCGPPLIQSNVLGLAFDACADRLLASYGRWTLPIRVVDAANCKFQFEACCESRQGGTWRGLTVRPAATVTHYGKACVGKGCPACHALTATTFGGAPVLGNASFGAAIENAPLGGHALLIVGAGRCTKGVGLPFLCGAIYPSLQAPTFFLGPLPLQGSLPCSASARALMPVPQDAKLCGAEICLQWLVLCPQGSGFALGDTWELRIG